RSIPELHRHRRHRERRRASAGAGEARWGHLLEGRDRRGGQGRTHDAARRARPQRPQDAGRGVQGRETVVTATLQPGSKLGNYELVEKIGAGGMGSVYKAYQPTLQRYVAIKVLPPQTAGDASPAVCGGSTDRKSTRLNSSHVSISY